MNDRLESNTRMLAEVGRRLRSVRKATGDLTQEAFAQELGVHRNTISALEKGEREISGSLLRVLMDRFDLDPAWVLRGPGDRPRKLDQYIDEDRLVLAAQRAEREIREERLEPTLEERWRFIAALYDLSSDPLDEANPSLKKLLRFRGR